MIFVGEKVVSKIYNMLDVKYWIINNWILPSYFRDNEVYQL